MADVVEAHPRALGDLRGHPQDGKNPSYRRILVMA
jgi:hypothetical protein